MKIPAVLFVFFTLGGLASFAKALALRSAGSTGYVLLGCGCFLVAGVTGVISLSVLFSRPFGSLFYPEETYDHPLPPYSRAEALVQRHEYVEAMKVYRALAEEYPEEVQPFVGMIEIAVRHLNDLELAYRIHREGMAKLKNHKQQALLGRMYRAIRSYAESSDEWKQRKKISMDPKV